MTTPKTLFVAFAIEDERSRDLLKGQSLHVGVLGILPPYIAKPSEAPVCRGL